MRMLITLAALALLSAAALAQPASSGAQGPEDVVRALFDKTMRNDTQDLTRESGMRRFFSPDLRARMSRMYALSRQQESVPCFNGDVSTGMQEYKVSDLKLRSEPSAGPRAIVVATFASFGKTYSNRYTVVNTHDGWRIDDIAYPGQQSLRRILGTCR